MKSQGMLPDVKKNCIRLSDEVVSDAIKFLKMKVIKCPGKRNVYCRWSNLHTKMTNFVFSCLSAINNSDPDHKTDRSAF